MNTKFIKHKLPCPKCDSSDAVSLNDNGSAKCFSCNTFFPDYENMNDSTVIEMKQPETSFLNSLKLFLRSSTDERPIPIELTFKSIPLILSSFLAFCKAFLTS